MTYIRNYSMVFMMLFSALYSHWAMAIPLPANADQVSMPAHHQMIQSTHKMKMDMPMQGCHGMQMAMQQQDLPQMSYSHYCPYCHGPCHFDMDQCHVIYPVADLMSMQFSFEMPSAMPVFSIQSILPVEPTSKHIRPPRFA